MHLFKHIVIRVINQINGIVFKHNQIEKCLRQCASRRNDTMLGLIGIYFKNFADFGCSTIQFYPDFQSLGRIVCNIAFECCNNRIPRIKRIALLIAHGDVFIFVGTDTITRNQPQTQTTYQHNHYNTYCFSHFTTLLYKIFP